MAELFCEIDGTEVGPMSGGELKEMAADGRLPADAPVWKSGSAKRRVASSIPGLFAETELAATAADHQGEEQQETADGLGADSPTADASPEQPPRSDGSSAQMEALKSQAAAVAGQTLQTARGHAGQLLTDLKGVDFKDEVVPIDGELAGRMGRDVVFWIVTALAVVPLLISTVERQDFQLTAFALFFAVLWGVMFKLLVVRSEMTWPPLISSMLLTGCIGIPLLLFGYSTVVPESYQAMASSQSGVTSLIGFVLQVGVCEELIKIVPVVLYLLWKRKEADPIGAVLIGVFSGLGFAAFENVSYGQRAILGSALMADEAGWRGAAFGTQQAMVMVMLRSLSLVFCHAVWSGIFAYFLTTGFAAGKRLPAMFVIGLAVAAVTHGVYDWLCGVQPTFAALIVAGSFMLFYAYLTKLRLLVRNDAHTADDVTVASTLQPA